MNEARLKWQCRRGMRELDVLLSAWLENDYPTSPDDEKAAFRRLLTLSDPELNRYLLRGDTPGDAAVARIVARLRGHSPP